MNLLQLKKWNAFKKLTPLRSGYGKPLHQEVPGLLQMTVVSLSLFICFFLIMQTPVFAQDEPQKAEPAQENNEPANENPNPEQPEGEAAESKLYPDLEEMLKRIPSAKDLVQNPPVDWIVINETNAVIPALQVFPRPDTIAKMDQKLKEFDKNAPPRETEAEEEEYQEKRKALLFLEFSIYDDAELKTPRLFQINYNKINTIIYYEDLMLKRIDLLREEHRIRDAFELLHQLRRRDPNWKGIEQAHNRILYSAAEKEASEKHYEDALFKLEELYGRDRRFPNLSKAMGIVSNELIQNAVNAEDYRQARFFIRRLEKYFPKQEMIEKWSQILSDQSSQLVQESEKLYREKNYRQAAITVKKAARIWPGLSGLSRSFNKICQRHQVLKVGVVDQSSEDLFPIMSDGNSRYLELTQSKLFEVESVKDIPHYRTKYFEKWTPTDLGRQTVFDIRPGRSYWESQPVIYSSDLAQTFRNKLDPNHPDYNERLEYFVNSVSVQSPYRMEVIFSHVPLKPEFLLRFPFPVDPMEQPVENLPSQLKPVRFGLVQKTDSESYFTRVKPEPDEMNLADYHVSEIIETKFSSYDEVVQKLLREQLDFVPKLPPAMAKQLEEDERFFVLPYSIPEVHIIQFNPRSEAIRNRQIRRAMAYSLDLDKLKSENILDSVPYDDEDITTAPFPQDSYAFNKTMVPRKYDLSAAVPLVLITKKKMGDEFPKLKMISNPEPGALKAAKAIAKQWNMIGIPVTLSEESTRQDDWDIAYRVIKMTEPVTDLWPFLANDPQVRIESLNHLPDWLRQEVIQLERTSNWNDAVRILQNLHRHLYEEVEYIPLWQIYQKMVITKKADGFSNEPISPYYNLERWNITPWYSKQYQ